MSRVRYLPGGHGIELRQRQDDVRRMFEGVTRIGVAMVGMHRAMRFYRIIVINPRTGAMFTPTGAIAAALGMRIRDGVAGMLEIALPGGNFDGHQEIASELATLLGRELEVDVL